MTTKTKSTTKQRKKSQRAADAKHSKQPLDWCAACVASLSVTARPLSVGGACERCGKADAYPLHEVSLGRLDATQLHELALLDASLATINLPAPFPQLAKAFARSIEIMMRASAPDGGSNGR